MTIGSTGAAVSPWLDEPEGSTIEEVIFLLKRQKELFVAVATGTSISDKQAEFDHRSEKLRQAYRRMGIENPFPWTDLYSFWAHAKQWSTYAERRAVLADEAQQAIDALTTIGDDSVPGWDLPDLAPWQPLSERAADLKTEYETATTIDDLQDVGRRARQIIIQAVKQAWHESMVPEGEPSPRGDDVATKLEHILAAKIPGPSNERIRKSIRSALELGHEGAHSENQERFDALAAAMGALMAVKLLQHLDAIEPR